ncbi:tyrosine phosphatase family-domain-containing protein [Dipodascopsis uninucleata]
MPDDQTNSQEANNSRSGLVYRLRREEDENEDSESRAIRKQVESQLFLSTSPLSPPPLRAIMHNISSHEVGDNIDIHEPSSGEADGEGISGDHTERFDEQREEDLDMDDVEVKDQVRPSRLADALTKERLLASPPSTPSHSAGEHFDSPYTQHSQKSNIYKLSQGTQMKQYQHQHFPQEGSYSHNGEVWHGISTTQESIRNGLTVSNTSSADYSHISSSRMSSSISSITNFFDRPETRLLVPPLNFAMVASGIYRSGHPLPINFPFLERLKLKTIIYLGENELRQVNQEWADKNGIRVYHFKMESCKLPFIENDPKAIESALGIVADSRNFPILMHSNKGKHRVGVLVGAMRKLLQRWNLASIFDEYSQFAAGKEDSDIEFIEIFNVNLQYEQRYAPVWLRP